MSRRPEQCPSRAPLGPDDGSGRAACGVVRLTGAEDAAVSAVGRDACEACCRSLRPGEEVNPVVASLVFGAAGAILRAGGSPAATRPGRGGSATGSSRISASPTPATTAAPSRPRPRGTGGSRDGRGLAWAVGVLTAPRDADPGRHPPRPGARRVRGGRRLRRAGLVAPARPGAPLRPRQLPPPGELRQLLRALDWLYRHRPEAECIAVFQDDVEAAEGLRAWCDAQLWPLGAGLVSLFTPRVHGDDRPGWRLLTPGYFRVYGGQALAFRRDVLEAFLSDPTVLREVRGGQTHGDDALVAAWAARRQMPIAYHTPSLVQHVGHVSSIYDSGPDRRTFADAVASVADIDGWRPPPRRAGKVGLVGGNARTGLGYQNDDLARNLGLDRWLVPAHPWCGDRVGSARPCRVDEVSTAPDPQTIRAWLEGLDWVLFIERPCVPWLAQIARERQVSVACVPNWEWLHPGLDWLRYVDLMLCPTRHTYLHVSDWSRRYGFGWDVRHVPWPVDAGRFRFVERRRCDRFVFANGWGGGPAGGSTGGRPPTAGRAWS